MEQVQRLGTNSSGSKYGNNFQLIKIKTHNTKANPQQQPSYFNSYVSDNNSRYDYMSENKKQADLKQKSYSYRVRKSVGSKNSYKSQNGRTVYEIFNIRNKNNNDTKSYQHEPTNKSDATHLKNDDNGDHNTFSSKSQAIFIDHKHKVLATDKKITEPEFLQSSPHPRIKDYGLLEDNRYNQRYKYNEMNSTNKINIRRNKPLYFQKQWEMNEAANTNENNQNETKIGSIIKQQIFKQPPLNPSKPQDINKMLQRQVQQLFEKKKQEEAEQTIQHSTKKRKVKNNMMIYDKELIHRLNLRTKYYRFKHNERIKQKLEAQSYKINSINNQMSSNSNNFNHQKLCLSKNPSFAKIHTVQFTHLSKVQDIIKALHHFNENRLMISIKVPKIFHSVPDQLLPLEQLKFKAVMIFEELGIMRPGLICEDDEIKIIKHPESLTFLYDCQANQKGDQYQFGNQIRKMGKFCINWYSDGSVYMGQLENDYRQGLALEWVPGVYAYFGQYEQNYRHGYGVMKYNNKEVYIGVWSYDCYHGYGKLIDEQGWVIKQGVFRNSQIKIQGEYNQLS